MRVSLYRLTVGAGTLAHAMSAALPLLAVDLAQ